MWDVVAGAERKGVSERQAACHLLLEYWSYDREEGEVDQFHWINEDAYLSIADIMTIARNVWEG